MSLKMSLKMCMKRSGLYGLLLVFALPAMGQIPNGAILKNNQIASGLKEALQVGALNAVKLTGRLNGYFGNSAIRIPLPQQLHPVEQVLRAVGAGKQVDAFVLSMNRAAERAAPKAAGILVTAIRQISFDDARAILTRGGTSATDYFRRKTTAQLTAAFKPTVAKAMNEVGVTRQYEQLVGKYQDLPFLSGQNVNLDQYVVGKALDGLFHVLGEQELRIRSDPLAQITHGLRQIFGSHLPG